MPYSALLGLTVDTNFCQFTGFSGPHYALVTDLRRLCRGAESDSLVQTVLSDHRDSPVAGQCDRDPVAQIVQVVVFLVVVPRPFPMVQTVVGPKRFPSCSST